MRTTLSIADELLAEAKRRARASGQPLGAVVEAALRRDFARSPSDAPRPPLPVIRGGSAPSPGLDLTSTAALHEVLDDRRRVDDSR
jgi:hypothetical protein